MVHIIHEIPFYQTMLEHYQDWLCGILWSDNNEISNNHRKVQSE